VRGSRLQIGIFWWVCLGVAAWADSGTNCIVCAETTRGDHAVVHEGTAYFVHDYPCRRIWDRVLAEGELDDLPGLLTPGDERFQGVHLDEARQSFSRSPGGSPAFWAFFVFLVALLSGGLAALFAFLLNRSPLRGFLIGFLLPAVGMVLVPVLRETNSSRNLENEGGPPHE
jgi:hypothetical protein